MKSLKEKMGLFEKVTRKSNAPSPKTFFIWKFYSFLGKIWKSRFFFFFWFFFFFINLERKKQIGSFFKKSLGSSMPLVQGIFFLNDLRAQCPLSKGFFHLKNFLFFFGKFGNLELFFFIIYIHKQSSLNATWRIWIQRNIETWNKQSNFKFNHNVANQM